MRQLLLEGHGMPKYITAFDPILGKRVVHVVVNGYAVSLVTRHKFKYHP